MIEDGQVQSRAMPKSGRASDADLGARRVELIGLAIEAGERHPPHRHVRLRLDELAQRAEQLAVAALVAADDEELAEIHQLGVGLPAGIAEANAACTACSASGAPCITMSMARAMAVAQLK